MESVCLTLKDALTELKEQSIITSLYGLSYVREFGEGDGTSIFPVPYDFNDECDEIYCLVPDETKRCIVYFEAPETFPIKKNTFSGDVDLVCWINTKMFSNPSTARSFVLSKIIELIDGPHYGEDVTFTATVKSLQEGKGLFKQFSYHESILWPPFTAFSLNISINSTHGCISNQPIDLPC